MVVRGLFALCLLLSMCTTVCAQEYHYDIIRGGKAIGLLTAKKEFRGDSVIYDLSSTTSFKMLFTITVKYNLHETYVRDTLVSGHSLSTLSGTVQREAWVRKEKDYYEIESTSDRVRITTPAILYSVPEIYFSKPEATTNVFSQVFAEYLVYEKTDDNTFAMYSEDGKNVYYYKNNICVKAEVFRPYANFSMVLKEKKR